MGQRALLYLTLLLAPTLTAAADLGADFSHLLDSEPRFLSVDEAFRLTADLGVDGSIQAQWQMPDGYYLYRHRFAFHGRPDGSVTLGEAEIPPGKRKIDEYFGEVEVYYHEARARVPVVAVGGSPGTFEVGISYQGCADAGLCYPPETRWFSFPTGTAASAAVATRSAVSAPVAGAGSALTEEQRLAGLLGDGRLWLALLLFYAAGVGLAFTPCVLPMVPILSSIIVGQGNSVTRARATTLSLAYVIGMAVTYAVLGVVVGLFGASMNLQAALQSPPVLIGFAAVFVLLSLSMFGFYDLRLPRFLQDRLSAASSRQGGGKHLGVAAMGSLSSLVVSPCVSAPLAGALIYLSTTGDAVLGGGALLALGIGMGTPLLIIGASGGHLLPRAGAWMDTVKAVFGVSLLAVAIWLLERVVPAGVALSLWSALAIGAGVYLGALDFGPRRGWDQLWKATGAFSFIYGVLLLIGAASGASDPLKPLSEFAAENSSDSSQQIADVTQWRTVKDGGALDAAIATASALGRPVVLDFYADWCISCKVMERSVFPAPEVAASLAEFELLRADVTANDPTDRALLERLGLFGPPSIVFFDGRGRELVEYRIQGEMDRVTFAAHLSRLRAHLGGDRGSASQSSAPEVADI